MSIKKRRKKERKNPRKKEGKKNKRDLCEVGEADSYRRIKMISLTIHSDFTLKPTDYAHTHTDTHASVPSCTHTETHTHHHCLPCLSQ